MPKLNDFKMLSDRYLKSAEALLTSKICQTKSARRSANHIE